jgi:hypothetical protein
VCAVCWKTLGPWDWDKTFPLAVKHDREI